MRRAAITTGFAAVLVAATAAAYEPLPWDVPPRERTSPDRIYSPRPRRSLSGTTGTRSLFGTTGIDFDWAVRFGGDLADVSPGRGMTMEIPATLPAWLVYALIDPSAVFAPLTSDAWVSAMRGEGLGTSPVLDEVAFVFLLSESTHDDPTAGGDVTCTRYGLGVRMTGPGPAARRVRGTVSAGWSWGEFDFDMRPGLYANGPYAGIGVEARMYGTGCGGARSGGAVIGVRASARWEWLRGLDGLGGSFSTNTFTAGAGVVFYW